MLAPRSSLSPFSTRGEDDSSSGGGDVFPRKRKFAPQIYELWSNASSHNDETSLESSDEDILEKATFQVSDGDIIHALSLFQKPKRTRFLRNRPVPRLFHNDVRQHYAVMLMNALNSHDSLFMRSFVDQYMLPNATFLRPTVKSELMTKPTLRFNSVQTLLRFWNVVNRVTPDAVHEVNDVRVIRYNHTDACKVVCNVVTSFTQMYVYAHEKNLICSEIRAAPRIESTPVAGVFELRSAPEGESSDDNSTSSEDTDCAVACGPIFLRLLPKPIPVIMATTLTFHINEVRQIAGLEYGSATLAY